MGAQVSIGDFSVMARLSKKALRHYHDLGLLEPAHINAHTGYRFYDTSQVDHAHIIRRFRSLGMSIPDVKALLSTDDVGERNEIITTHLRHMEEQLQQTQDTVRELGELLSRARRHTEVGLRFEPPTAVWAITSTVDIDDIGTWFFTASEQLSDALRRSGICAAASSGGAAETWTRCPTETRSFPCRVQHAPPFAQRSRQPSGFPRSAPPLRGAHDSGGQSDIDTEVETLVAAAAAAAAE
jgi:DNA-binding transcriptional MerR regulator